MENEIYEKHVCENETVLIQLNTFLWQNYFVYKETAETVIYKEISKALM